MDGEILTSNPNGDSEQQKWRDLIPMVEVEGGAFDMGNPENFDEACVQEQPVHKVTLSAYKIGKYPITQAQWKAVMGTNPSYFGENDDTCPVENISWQDAVLFCKNYSKLTGVEYRLPTEAEWEFAARGGNKSQGYKYSGSNNIDEVSWYGSNSHGKTQPVGQMKANELGIYDMSGNVLEWCKDFWQAEYVSASQANPQGPGKGSKRLLRGGNWALCDTASMVTRRDCEDPSKRSRFNGLRIVTSE